MLFYIIDALSPGIPPHVPRFMKNVGLPTLGLGNYNSEAKLKIHKGSRNNPFIVIHNTERMLIKNEFDRLALITQKVR